MVIFFTAKRSVSHCSRLFSLGSLSPTTRHLDFWSLRLSVFDSTAQLCVLGLTAKLSVLSSTDQAHVLHLNDQRPSSLPPSTSGLVLSRQFTWAQLLCGLCAKIDRQKKTFQIIWRCFKDTEDSSDGHPQHTETHTHTSIYIYIYTWTRIIVPQQKDHLISARRPDQMMVKKGREPA